MTLSFKNIALRACSGLALLGVALQFVRPTLTHPPVEADLEAPAAVKQILRTACYNCHSNQTVLPWFDRIVPAYWLVVHDVDTGRKVLNFSDFGKLPAAKQKALLYESLNQVELGAMPPKAYTRVHPEAVFSHEQLQTLENYLNPAEPLLQASSAEVATATRQHEDWLTGNAERSTASVKPALNGLAFFADYRDWRPISTTDRFDNHTLRVILGNGVAQRALAANRIHPWPDGAAFAKLAWAQLVEPDGSVRSGAFKQVEFMLKDSSKYASTQGWGFGRWLGTGLVPYGKDADFARECTGCHAPMSENDFVYTLPITQLGAASSSRFVNQQAVLPATLPMPPLAFRVLASGVDLSQGTMSTLYGNDLAIEHARSQSLTAPYPPGATLSLVTWSQQRDAHWFGGKLPSALRSIETVTAGATPTYAYQRVFAAPQVKAGAQIPDSARAAFIVAQEPAVMP